MHRSKEPLFIAVKSALTSRDSARHACLGHLLQQIHHQATHHASAYTRIYPHEVHCEHDQAQRMDWHLWRNCGKFAWSDISPLSQA